MYRVDGKDLIESFRYVTETAAEAKKATCLRAQCGSVIVRDQLIIGRGYNSPPLNNEANRQCNIEVTYNRKPKSDKTCCVHAEWRAILDASKCFPDKLGGAVIYFMRLDKSGKMSDSKDPYCTVCSRLILDSGIAEVALWNNHGLDIYSSDEYNILSYNFHKV